MATEITLPRLGQGMESGIIVRWLKAEGDAVSKGEPLYELDTEKVTQEVEADAAGVLLRILEDEGAEVPVGTPIAMIGEEGEEVAGAPAPAAASVKSDTPAPEGDVVAPAAVSSAPSVTTPAPSVPAAAAPAAVSGGRVKASPLARRIAKDRGVDLAQVQGTGPEGRIVAEDVERAAAGEAPGTTPAFGAPAAMLSAEAPAVQTVEFTAMRRTIARRMTEAWQAPHFQVSLTADVGRMIELRKRLVEGVSEGDVRPTYSDIITKLVAVALTRHPALNAHFAGDAVHQYGPANIGMAIAVDGGLVVPVIPACERRSVPAIAAARTDLVARSRAGKLTTDDFAGGTFTISNLGMFGIERFTAVINPPQVGILAIGSIEERVVALDGEMVVQPRMEMTLSCDHRAVDGAQGAEFLRTVKELLEEPGLAL